MTTAEARRNWAKVLRGAERGMAVEVTRNGLPVAAVVPIRAYREIEASWGKTLADVVSWFRGRVDPADLEGPDLWDDARDGSPGRRVSLGR